MGRLELLVLRAINEDREATRLPRYVPTSEESHQFEVDEANKELSELADDR